MSCIFCIPPQKSYIEALMVIIASEEVDSKGGVPMMESLQEEESQP